MLCCVKKGITRRSGLVVGMFEYEFVERGSDLVVVGYVVLVAGIGFVHVHGEFLGEGSPPCGGLWVSR